ncbi:DUF2750 domain-containing protein [Rhizobium leguminosarum]|uniref:DUF2750 domain-containing protein n=1 Tax=Rhizobium beringeri TaxID=3019934 RepID=A0ABY1XH27_9HYPH|nr:MULTISPECIES: DUF2750 domain-containing protein [Rhizobium]MBY5460563.1 DUF2750 domain-containing protein [Rhizobium leguminosarum]NKL65326.1 DUF2750 domain-containing protein [Rhizobium leguminosarum bv. viciae]TBC54519.1 DUF2750 domain-containing protein [Rhizobium leguminosarum]TBE57847.1 DUF2750 domain-containing protein [Rhizobium beringeri]
MSISAINADTFVSEVLNGRQVWGIRDRDGFPTSTNASGETAMPFWSSQKRAMSIIKTVPAYSDFTLEPISLPAFVERWLPGLQKDGLHCGLNWSGARATGYDLSPADLMARLATTQGNP